MMMVKKQKKDSTLGTEAEWFGYQRVGAAQKTGLVRGVFGSVAQQYDLMNDLMSGGVHRFWKRHFVRRIAAMPGEQALDVAGGTGDIAFALAGAGADVTVCDLTEPMVRVGRDRAIDRALFPAVRFVVGNAECLPVPDKSCDIYTISFGLRNVTQIDKALLEARRVLKPGGRFFCLEFSRVAAPLRPLYDLYSFAVLPRLGRWVARDEASYRYLAESIRQFPPQEELAERMAAAGLKKVSYENLSGGIAAIHSAVR